jgi:hypothetical protein
MSVSEKSTGQTTDKGGPSYCKRLVILFLVVDSYFLSFFLFAKPCANINRMLIPPGKPYVYDEWEDLPDYPCCAVLCVSERPVVNRIGYVVYWPVHRFLAWRYLFAFAPDPTKEIWR